MRQLSASEESAMKKLDEYLKVSEASDYLGISVNTLRKWADEGRIPVRINAANGYRLFQREDLEGYLTQTAKSVQRVTRSKTKKNRTQLLPK